MNYPYDQREHIDKMDSAADDFEDETCGECGGEGYIVADCFEDTCCCLDPEAEHGLIVCPTCRNSR